MVERYDYAYKIWHCRIDSKVCDIEGQCDRCYWAKIYREEEALNSQETSNSLEPNTKEREK